jgi:hypothetical protein
MILNFGKIKDPDNYNYKNNMQKINQILQGILFCFVLIPTLIFAQKTKQTHLKPELIFQSGFEGTTRVVQDLGTNDLGAPYEHIAGLDNTLKIKNDWDSNWASVLKNGKMQVQYTGGDSSKRFAKIISEPNNPNNHVLQFWLNEGWKADLNLDKARIQTNLYGIIGGYKEFYQSVRVFLTEDFNVLKDYPGTINWITISEFWNNEGWAENEKYGFRFGLMINKLTKGHDDLHFVLHAQDHGIINGKWVSTNVWGYENKIVKVPVGKWFTMDYYFKEGDKNNGQFYLTITPDGESKLVVFNLHDITHCTYDPDPDGLGAYNPLKLYTSKELIDYVRSQGKTLQIYWDDFKLWKNKRP